MRSLVSIEQQSPRRPCDIDLSQNVVLMLWMQIGQSDLCHTMSLTQAHYYAWMPFLTETITLKAHHSVIAKRPSRLAYSCTFADKSVNMTYHNCYHCSTICIRRVNRFCRQLFLFFGKILNQFLTSFFKNILEDISLLCWDTDTPVLDFWTLQYRLC